MNTAEGSSGDQQPPEFVFRDRRKVDPETGEIRQQKEQEPAVESAPAAAAGDTGDLADEETEKLRTEVEDRTRDLQRVQAEYVNYRRRVDREKEALRTETVGRVLGSLLPVLDDLDRAREHGELTGGFKSVADTLEKATAGHGLQRFGEEGEPFDPTVHEAMTHEYSPDVEGITCTHIYQPGYRVGERVLRAARVAVTEAEGGVVPASVEGALSVHDTDTAEGAGPAAEGAPDASDDATP